MKQRYLCVYGLMVVFFAVMGVFYHSAEDMYAVLCAGIYYAFVYTPLYLYMISSVVKESFYSVLVLRAGSKAANAARYIKKIIMHTILFSICFVGCLILAEISSKGAEGAGPWQFYLVLLFLQAAGLGLLGFFYYLIYTITRNSNAAVLLAWSICIIMALSGNVLFRPGKYIYNLFQTMVVWNRSDGYADKIWGGFGNVVLCMILTGIIVKCQKKMDLVERRR